MQTTCLLVLKRFLFCCALSGVRTRRWWWNRFIVYTEQGLLAGLLDLQKLEKTLCRMTITFRFYTGSLKTLHAGIARAYEGGHFWSIQKVLLTARSIVLFERHKMTGNDVKHEIGQNILCCVMYYPPIRCLEYFHGLYNIR